MGQFAFAHHLAVGNRVNGSGHIQASCL
jgi:hypothetical protein